MSDKKIILLVEDDPHDEKLTLMALRKNNIINEIITVRDGQEALDYIFGTHTYKGKEVPNNPQLILLDLNLPKISGMEVLKKIRSDERTKFFPVVILTSSTDERDLLESYDLGANIYIQKPVDFEQFATAIRDLGLYMMVLNDPVKIN